MNFLLIFFTGAFLMYLVFILALTIGLLRLRRGSEHRIDLPSVSVIIAARNEEKNLPQLLQDLSKQEYPNDKYEVIIADDRSEDSTWNIISEYASGHSNIIGVQITKKSEDMTPKKHALSRAIKASSGGEIILSTDADCRIPMTWIHSMVHAFDPGTGIVVGLSTVQKNPNSLLNQHQFLDFFALMTANAGAIGWNRAWSGSGQNLAYKRSFYDKIGGFTSVADELSGDDMFLVQSIAKYASVYFNLDSHSFVTTEPVQSLSDFFSQQIRWASNTKKLSGYSRFGFLFFLLTTYFTNVGLFISALFFPMFSLFIPAIFIKFVFDTLLFTAGAIKFHFRLNPIQIILWVLFQIIYIPMLGVLSLIGRFNWKATS